MHKDSRLPESENELRDWLVEAWKDGWRHRALLHNAPTGTREDQKSKRLDAFLLSWDLPPSVKPPAMTKPAGAYLVDNGK